MTRPKTPLLAADGVILEKGKVLLIKRAIKPYLGYWTLPGGHVNCGETIEKAVKREVKEEMGIDTKIKKLIGVYSDPKRDPRYHIVSVAFLLSGERGKIKLNYESSEFKFFGLKKLPKKIGFGHREIIKDLKKLE